MDYALVVVAIAAVFLAIGGGIVLLAKRLTRGLDARDPGVFGFLMGTLVTIHGVSALFQTLDGKFIWQGAAHVVSLFGWLLFWRLERRNRRKARDNRGY